MIESPTIATSEESAGTPQTQTDKTAFYRRIGRQGGLATREKYGEMHFAALGRKGGQTTTTRYGRAYFARIGRKGAAITRERYGPEFFRNSGKKGRARGELITLERRSI